MATVRRSIARSPEDVFATLLTPSTYPDWLVGCQDIRAIDADWPAVGSKFHHRVGLAGPLTVADSTEVLEIEEPSLLVLEARARPLGRARVRFELRSEGTASSPRTLVTLDEVPLGLLSPAQPAIDVLTAPRNVRSLQRLAELVETPST